MAASNVMIRNHSGPLTITNPDGKGEPFRVAFNAIVASVPAWVQTHPLYQSLVRARTDAGGIGGIEVLQAG